jgi:uncharacterized protein
VTVFIDTNVPMYLVGAPHPNRERARSALEQAVDAGERLVTDAEVLQEIVHRYTAIGRRDAIQPAMATILDVVDEVFPVDADAVVGAVRLLERMPRLSSRDAIHVVLMRRHGVDDVMTFDSAFDLVGGIRRLPG